MGGCHDVLTKEHKGESRSRYRLCIPPCPHYIKQAGYTQFVSGMIGSEACRVDSRGGRLPAFWGLPLRTLCILENSLWGGSFYQRSSQCRPRFHRGGAVAVLVGIADGSDEGNEDGWAPIFFLSHQIQRPLSGIGSPPHGSLPPPRERARHSACLLPRRGTGRTSMSFRKLNVCTSILWKKRKRKMN